MIVTRISGTVPPASAPKLRARPSLGRGSPHVLLLFVFRSFRCHPRNHLGRVPLAGWPILCLSHPKSWLPHPLWFSKGGLPDCLRGEGLRFPYLHLGRTLFVDQHRSRLAESMPPKTAPHPLLGFEHRAALHRATSPRKNCERMGSPRFLALRLRIAATDR